MIIVVWICILLAIGMMKILDNAEDKKSAKTMIWIGVFLISIVASIIAEGLGIIMLIILSIARLVVWAYEN